MTRYLLTLLCALSLLATAISPVHAGMISTDQLLEIEQGQVDRAQWLSSLEREDVQQQLARLGVSPADAAQRIARMTDQEIHQLNQRLEELPAGAASVLGVVVLVFIVFVITDAIGATDIFPFVRPVQ
ncbi:hypothetical protein SAMN05421693_12134 [Ectothiorhodospira magna]|uniref:PA2779 family protein n=1 Tax=Ectothiorhodospira magna TaxID=867345 RepID=A0A1H9EDC3_9GAMM|nr:DUF6627 family protein [Ectothiorhodospira magna]SEQ23724.1 hypothetical protein SAMN05421693_12134 [Ectothiorhodospira magna]